MRVRCVVQHEEPCALIRVEHPEAASTVSNVHLLSTKYIEHWKPRGPEGREGGGGREGGNEGGGKEGEKE